jgi:hypothetical protein
VHVSLLRSVCGGAVKQRLVGSVLAEGVSIPEGSTLTACLNDTCADSVLTAATASGAGFGRYAMFPLEAGVLGFVWAPHGPGGIHVEMSWFPDQGRRNLQAGDRYSVTLTDPAGATIATKQATATSYVTHTLSNGPGCHNDCPVAQFPQ